MTFLDRVKATGVVGAGGAGFPTHVKLNAQARVLIINGIECEPLLMTDKYLMRQFSQEIVAGAVAIGNHLQAEQIVIAVKSKNKVEIQRLASAIQEKKAPVELQEIDDFYPAGDEQMLVREVLGITIEPNQIPLSKGIVVTNVATVLDVVRQQPVTHRVVSVGGAVHRPCLLQVPVGTSLQACLEAAGGATEGDYHALVGGPMMGRLCLREDLATTYVTKTVGGIILLPSHHPIIQHHQLSMDKCLSRAASVCIQCRMCTDLCPRYLNGHPLHPHRVMRSVAFGHITMESCESALLCCSCGVCEHYACPMGLSPKMINDAVKAFLLQGGIKWTETSSGESDPHFLRSHRQVPTQRLIHRLGLQKYQVPVPEEVTVLSPHRVVLGLKQHIGKPATPVVKHGARVSEGELLATVGDALGAEIHSSMAGVVQVEPTQITVERS